MTNSPSLRKGLTTYEPTTSEQTRHRPQQASSSPIPLLSSVSSLLRNELQEAPTNTPTDQSLTQNHRLSISPMSQQSASTTLASSSPPTRENRSTACTISPYHTSTSTGLDFRSTPSPKRLNKEQVRFLYQWLHKPASMNEKPTKETLSLSAPNGMFRPFEDEQLVSHLRLDNMKSIQHLDTATSTWITILRSSPPIVVRPNSTYRFKEVDTDIHLSAIFDLPAIRTSSRLFKTDSLDSIIDISTTPSKVGRSCFKEDGAVDVSNVGSRPCRIPKFPGATLKEVDERFRWINENVSFGSLQTRFSAVYSCAFSSSTFHRHQNAWRWLNAQKTLELKSNDEPWKELSQQAWRIMTPSTSDGSTSPAAIDLT